MNCPLLGMLEIAVNKRDMFSNDLIVVFLYLMVFKGKKGALPSYLLNKYLFKTYYVPSALICLRGIKKHTHMKQTLSLHHKELKATRKIRH